VSIHDLTAVAMFFEEVIEQLFPERGSASISVCGCLEKSAQGCSKLEVQFRLSSLVFSIRIEVMFVQNIDAFGAIKS
jgi:hypothetical protein